MTQNYYSLKCVAELPKKYWPRKHSETDIIPLNATKSEFISNRK